MRKPSQKPVNPHFCSGPCAKFPGWELDSLSDAMISRSHRSKDGEARIRYMLEKTQEILHIPSTYKVALVPGSATGAISMAMWNFLGSRPVDILVWDVFGRRWASDVKALNIPLNLHEAPFGEMPSINKVDPNNDLLFVWHTTSTGGSIGDLHWKKQGEGLVICDATSAAFCVDLPWDKLDITCFSWQKGMGSEGGHGIIVLSPKALEHLKQYTPKWPIPYLLNLKGPTGEIRAELFDGVTINTPSMLCLEDYIQSLHWAERNGGLLFLTERAMQNYETIKSWVENRPWAEFLVQSPLHRSTANSCLRLRKNGKLMEENDVITITQTLAAEKAAFDIKGFKGLPGNLRIWTGPTIEKADLEVLLEWIEWAYLAHI